MKYNYSIFNKSVVNFIRNRSFVTITDSYTNHIINLKSKPPNFNSNTRLFFHNVSTNSDVLSKRFNDNVLKPTNYDEYHNIVYKPLDTDRIDVNHMVVSVFYNKQSTASLSVLDSVNKLSSDFPQNKFLLVDSDLVPRSAYDADVQHFPSALLSYGGDLYRDLVSEESGFTQKAKTYYSWSFSNPKTDNPENDVCVLPQKFYDSVARAMKKFSSFNGKKVSSIKTKAGTHSYTHGIDTDNLNLKRVGWPTE